jgi:AraC family carnitine catabolism transcriptional activator
MPVRIGFLLVRLFPLYVVVLATEALRLANKYAGRRQFDWALLSDDGRPIEASNGIQIDCDASVTDARDLAYAFVVAGDDQTRTLTRRIRHWLLRTSKSRTVLGAIDSGAFLLAECRLIRSRRVAVHPAATAAFREQYPGIVVRNEPVVRDGTLVTCAGGVSIVDLMLSLIQEHCSQAVARSVADDMVLSLSSAGTDGRKKTHAAVSIEDIVELMRQAVEEPISLHTLSARTGLSRRRITRLFQRNLGRAPMRYYRTLRLNHAKQLLFQSDLGISKIAVASGFESLSAFSRCFSKEFGCSPRNLLSSLRKDGNASAVPLYNKSKRIRLGVAGYGAKS